MSQPQLIPIEVPPEKTHTQVTAEQLIHNANAEFIHRIRNHQTDFGVFWNSPMTPDALLEAMGTAGAKFLAGSRLSVEDIRSLGQIIQPDPALYEAFMEEIFPMSTWYPRRELIEHEDGTVTLAPPAEGFDAWGRPIPPPADEESEEEI